MDRATKTDARLDAHDVRCTERWKEARDTWNRVESTISSVQKSVENLRAADAAQAVTVAASRGSWMGPTIAALAALVVLLMGGVGTLSFYLMTHGH